VSLSQTRRQSIQRIQIEREREREREERERYLLYLIYIYKDKGIHNILRRRKIFGGSCYLTIYIYLRGYEDSFVKLYLRV